jgi:hypothetical protein
MLDLEKLFAEKNITLSSRDLYIKNLTRLNDGQPIKNIHFLKDEQEIQAKLEKYKPNTRRSYYIAIVSLLKVFISQSNGKKYQKLYEKYYSQMESLNKELKSNNEKSAKERENWITQEEVLERLEKLKAIIPTLGRKINATQFHELQKLLLLGLYALQKPRRNKDYQDMLVFKKKPVSFHYAIDCKGNLVDFLSPTKHNILDLKGNQFIFTNYKTMKKFSNQEITIHKDLRDIIDLYLKHHPTFKKSKQPVQLLVNYQGEPYTNVNDITRLLYKIFDKKIGSTMLRHIFLTSKYKNVLDEMEKDTEAMGTSVDMLENQYVKNGD